MALIKPFFNPIPAFNATVGNTLYLNVLGGSSISYYGYSIYDQISGEVVSTAEIQYANDVASEPIRTFPIFVSANVLQNNKSYNIVAYTRTASQSSPYSTPSYFTCYTTPTLNASITNIVEGVLESGVANLSVTFSSVDANSPAMFNKMRVTAYGVCRVDSSLKQIFDSGTIYDLTDVIEVSGFSPNIDSQGQPLDWSTYSSYVIEGEGETIDLTPISFSIQDINCYYEQTVVPDLFSTTNLCSEGKIEIKSGLTKNDGVEQGTISYNVNATETGYSATIPSGSSASWNIQGGSSTRCTFRSWVQNLSGGEFSRLVMVPDTEYISFLYSLQTQKITGNYIRNGVIKKTFESSAISGTILQTNKLFVGGQITLAPYSAFSPLTNTPIQNNAILSVGSYGTFVYLVGGPYLAQSFSIFDTSTNSYVYSYPIQSSSYITVVTANAQYAVMCVDSNFLFFNLSTRTFTTMQGSPNTVSYSMLLDSVRNNLYVANDSGQVETWQIFGSRTNILNVGSGIVRITQDDDNLYAISTGSNTFRIMNKNSYSVNNYTLPFAGAISITNDADNVYICGNTQFVVFNKTSRTFGTLVALPFITAGVVYSTTDDTNVYLSGYYGAFVVYDKASQTFSGFIPTPFDTNFIRSAIAGDYFCAVGCSNGPPAPNTGLSLYALNSVIDMELSFQKVWTVYFNTNGGSKVYDIVTNNLLELPMPVKNGYSFAGWYSDSSLIQRVTTPYAISADTTLYAKWV